MNNGSNHNRNGNYVKLDLEVISRLGVLGRGQIPWLKRKPCKSHSRLSEVEYAFILSRAESYRFEDGAMKGKPDYGKISDEINRVYHSGNCVRNRYSVRNALYKFKIK